MPGRVLIAVLCCLAAACGDTSEVTTTLPPAPARTVTTTSRAAADGPAPGPDLRFVDFGPQGFSAELVVTVEPGDASFLVWARAPDPLDEVAVIAVTDPAGELIYELDFDSFEVSGSLFGAPVADVHEVAMVLPAGESSALAPGDYVVEVETLADEIVAAGAIIRSGDVAGPQAIDVRLVDAAASAALGADFVDEVRAAGERLLAPHGISVGAVESVGAPAGLADRFSDLVAGESDEQQRALCHALSEELPPVRAVDVVVVDSFVDPADDEGVIEGNAAGLPGVVLTPGAVTSCVIVAADPDFDRTLLDRAGVVWHEAGHLLGLPHSSEADGSGFDFFADTPECPLDFDEDRDGLVDEFECPDGTNFMFHDTDSLVMSDDQAWFLRRHPLLYPAGSG